MRHVATTIDGNVIIEMTAEELHNTLFCVNSAEIRYQEKDWEVQKDLAANTWYELWKMKQESDKKLPF